MFASSITENQIVAFIVALGIVVVDAIVALVGLAYFNNRLGREDEAIDAAKRILLENPDFSVADFEKTLQFKYRVGPMNNLALLNKAGLV